jgi:hypothetical protein
MTESIEKPLLIQLDIALYLAVEMGDILFVGKCIEIPLDTLEIQYILAAAISLDTVKMYRSRLFVELAFEMMQTGKKVFEFIFELTCRTQID